MGHHVRPFQLLLEHKHHLALDKGIDLCRALDRLTLVFDDIREQIAHHGLLQVQQLPHDLVRRAHLFADDAVSHRHAPADVDEGHLTAVLDRHLRVLFAEGFDGGCGLLRHPYAVGQLLMHFCIQHVFAPFQFCPCFKHYMTILYQTQSHSYSPSRSVYYAAVLAEILRMIKAPYSYSRDIKASIMRRQTSSLSCCSKCRIYVGTS